MNPTVFQFACYAQAVITSLDLKVTFMESLVNHIIVIDAKLPKSPASTAQSTVGRKSQQSSVCAVVLKFFIDSLFTRGIQSIDIP